MLVADPLAGELDTRPKFRFGALMYLFCVKLSYYTNAVVIRISYVVIKIGYT